MNSADILETQVAALEQAWRSASPPTLDESWLAESVEPTMLARELAAVDMEHRWRTAGETPGPLGGQPRWEDYARCFPAVGPLENLPPELIAEEYRIRRLWGDRPEHAHFLSRFSARQEQLSQALTRIDAEQQRERFEPLRPRLLPQHDPRAPLPYSDFRLERMLGVGGMGKVYLAWQLSLQRPVAIKALAKSRRRDPDEIEHFLREGRVLASLRHPHIVGVIGLGRFPNGGCFLVMDWIEGGDLEQRRRRETFSCRQAIDWALQIANAVHYAHQQGVLHCDLKPGNILWDQQRGVCVSDFGLAQWLGRKQAESELRQGGTPAFMAPEQMKPAETWTPAVDVYGLGGILKSLAQADWPSELHAIIERCLQVRPQDRFATMAELIFQLADVRL